VENALIFRLGDIAALAQKQFQDKYQNIDPIIGINRQLRKQGFAVDIMTIDCQVSQKRVTLLVEDAKPDSAGYQFGRIDKDPGAHFEPLLITDLNQQGFYDLMCKGLVE
jgi:hypothetical protein